MIYAALLRGINVGGNNKVDMKKLKLSFESLGLMQVVTYINSGNVIFKTDRTDIGNITTEIESKIFADFGLSLKVLIMSNLDFENICKKVPISWVNDSLMKCDVLFLWEELRSLETIKMLNLVPEFDSVIYESGAIVWCLNKENYNQSAMSKFVKNPVYPKMTARNINTTRKILEIMHSLA